MPETLRGEYRVSTQEEHEVDGDILLDLAAQCGAHAATLIQLDRSGRNRREGEGLLFHQLVKCLQKEADPGRSWRKLTTEFYSKSDSWGVTGESFLSGRIVDVVDVNSLKAPASEVSEEHWVGRSKNHEPIAIGKDHDPNTPRESKVIKARYCSAIADEIGTSLRDMLVAPVQANNIMMGAIKLFNHSRCPRCAGRGGFASHLDDIRRAADQISQRWLNTDPVSCEVVAVYVDIVNATSFLIASGYHDGAVAFQMFTNGVQDALNTIEEEIRNRPRTQQAVEMGGIPFLEKFTGDGLLLVFPYDRAALMTHDRPENAHIWPHVKKVVLGLNDVWKDTLSKPRYRRVFREAAIRTHPARIAISSGPAYLGRFGTQLTAIGRPLIEASRIVQEKALFKEAYEQDTDNLFIVASDQFVEDFKLAPNNATRLPPVELRGLPGRRVLWELRLA